MKAKEMFNYTRKLFSHPKAEAGIAARSHGSGRGRASSSVGLTLEKICHSEISSESSKKNLAKS